MKIYWTYTYDSILGLSPFGLHKYLYQQGFFVPCSIFWRILLVSQNISFQNITFLSKLNLHIYRRFFIAQVVKMVFQTRSLGQNSTQFSLLCETLFVDLINIVRPFSIWSSLWGNIVYLLCGISSSLLTEYHFILKYHPICCEILYEVYYWNSITWVLYRVLPGYWT